MSETSEMSSTVEEKKCCCRMENFVQRFQTAFSRDATFNIGDDKFMLK